MSNPRLSEAIDGYLASCRGKGQAHNTTRGKETTLRSLLSATGNIRVRSLNATHIDMYLQANAKLGSGSRRANLSHLRDFQRWLHNRGMYPATSDMFKDHKTPRAPKKRKPAIENLEEFFDAAPHPRDRVLAALGIYTLLRTSEIVDIRWKDIDWSADGGPEIYAWKHKTQEWDSLPVTAELHGELLEWRAYVCKEMGVDTPDPGWYIVCQLTPVPFGAKAPTTIIKPALRFAAPLRRIKAMLEAVGIDEPGTGMHTMRRTGARAMLAHLWDVMGNDQALTIVSDMLGHKDLSTTMIYLDLDAISARRNKAIKGMRLLPDKQQIATMVDLESVRW